MRYDEKDMMVFRKSLIDNNKLLITVIFTQHCLYFL